MGCSVRCPDCAALPVPSRRPLPRHSQLARCRMLLVDGVVVRFGGVVAVDGLTLEVPAGTVTGLIGPNGSGKTTTFDVITGLRRPSRGRVVWNDVDITRATPGARARQGIGRTFQRLEMFGSLSVRENVL